MQNLRTRLETGHVDCSESICIGCVNNCLYCESALVAAEYEQNIRRGEKIVYELLPRDEWHVELFKDRAFDKKVGPTNWVLRFPSTHDVTLFNVTAFIRLGKMMLDAGNALIINTKPRMGCLAELLAEFAPRKEMIRLSFGITSLDDSLSSFWEPGAPMPEERLQCLQMAFAAGYRTSVHISPMLGGVDDVSAIVEAAASAVTDTITIKIMRAGLEKMKPMIDKPEEIKRAYVALQLRQRDKDFPELRRRYLNHQKFRWELSERERHDKEIMMTVKEKLAMDQLKAW